MAVIALITWWTVNAFIQTVSVGLANAEAKLLSLDRAATLALGVEWKKIATYMFNIGGLIGTLLSIPAAKVMGRRKMFGIFYASSAVAVMATFGLDLPPQARLVHVRLHRSHGVRRVRQLHLLPARAVPDPPARNRRRLLLQRRPLHRRRRAVPGRHRSRRAAPTR